MSKHQQILDELQTQISLKREFDFMNIYKGVPLVCKGVLIKTDHEAAFFEIKPPDSICLTWNKDTHILDNRMFSGIKAEVQEFDIHTGIAKVGNFNYTERGFGDRAMVRVEPQEPLPAKISWDNYQIEATIVDISLTGFGLQLDHPIEQTPTQNARVSLKFQLLDRDLEIPARVKAVFEADGGYRLATSFEDTSPGYGNIAQYITRRRVDLRQEIQEKYNQALKEQA